MVMALLMCHVEVNIMHSYTQGMSHMGSLMTQTRSSDSSNYKFTLPMDREGSTQQLQHPTLQRDRTTKLGVPWVPRDDIQSIVANDST